MKRQLLTLAGGVGAIVLTALILFAGNATIRGKETTETPEFTLDVPSAEDMSADETTDDVPLEPGLPVPEASVESAPVEAKPLRSIEPDTFGNPGAGEPLERIEARTPLSEPAAKPEPEPQILRHPVALSAGMLQFDNGMLQLDGIEPQAADRQCGDGASAWPCGLVARTAFRNYIRARAMTCIVPATTWQGTVTARCSIGDSDPARWLAENGWAEAAANSPLAASIETAKTAGLGFYGKDPREQIINPPDDPSDDPDSAIEPFDMAPESAQ